MKSNNVLDYFKQKLDVFLKDKVDSAIVVDIGSKLTLFNIQLKGKVEVTALKIVRLDIGKKNEVILKSLSNFIQENNILSKFVILKPQLSSLLIKRIQLPSVPDSELKEAIKWQLKEDASFDLSQAILDFSIIKKTEKDDGSKVLDIMCVLAQEQEVKLQVMPLKQLGLTCLAVGLIPFAYEKLIEKYVKHDEKQALGLLHLSEDLCCFNIYKGNKLEFYRELPILISQLRQSLMDTLVSDKGEIKLSNEEAEEVLFKIGVPLDDSGYKDKMNSTQILSLMRPMLERLAAEIKRSLTYYETHFQGDTVNEILIAGQGLDIKNLSSFLDNQGTPGVKNFALRKKIPLASGIDGQTFIQASADLGLALDYKNSINILPYEFRTEKIETFQKVSLRWTTFVVFLLLLVSFVFAKAGVGFLQKRIDNANVHLGVLSEVMQTKQMVDELNNFMAEVRNSEIPSGLMLKKLSHAAPRELFISDFSLNVNTNTGTIKGYIKKSDNNPNTVLTKFIADINNSDYFSQARIVSVTKSGEGQSEITQFQVEFELF